MPNNPFIDYSQYFNFVAKCPALWYEKAINARQPNWPKNFRDDPLAIGILVHAGMEVWQTTHQINIPQAVVDEVRPTPEALDMCYQLINGYAQAYPQERWPVVMCEEPLRFPLISADWHYACMCGNTSPYDSPTKWPEDCDRCKKKVTQFAVRDQIDGLAKIDTYFFNPTPCEIEDGLGGLIPLSVGWYIHEYKTKDPSIPIDLWMAQWQMKMQASFQILALKNKLQNSGEVQGILVNILEKPKPYTPKRKCPTCAEQFEFSLWTATEVPKVYNCPKCNQPKKLTPIDSEKLGGTPPSYYRMLVTRNAEQLERDFNQIKTVAQQMQIMRQGGLGSYPWNTESCVNLMHKKKCEYFENHTNNVSTLDDARMVQIEDYVKEKTNAE